MGFEIMFGGDWDNIMVYNVTIEKDSDSYDASLYDGMPELVDEYEDDVD